MKSKRGGRVRRSQAERTAATRTALVAAARLQFGADGYADVTTEQIVKSAGLTRGALYHHFADKEELFAAVLESVEADIMAELAAGLADVDADDPVRALSSGVGVWLDACRHPEVERIVLLDGPAVLGWERWRAVGLEHGLGLVTAVLQRAVDVGSMPSQPVLPLAHVLVGALDEAALYIARADDARRARAELDPVLARLVVSIVG